MLNVRSPWLPYKVGGVLLLSALALWLTEQELLSWILLTLALPLVLEGEAWRGAADCAPYFYEVDSEVVHWEAYNLRAALPRYLLLYICLFAILVGREAHVLPQDGLAALAILVGPALLWVAWAVGSFVRDIRQFMRSKGIQSTLSKRHNRS